MSAAERVTVLEAENAQLRDDLATLSADHKALKQQLEWFKRQLFGRKSEKRLDVEPAAQGNLLAALGVEAPPPPAVERKQWDGLLLTLTYRRLGARMASANQPFRE